MIRFEIEGRPLSWNKAHSGVHWAARKKINDEQKWLVKAALLNFRINKMAFKAPVQLEVVCYVGRPIDCDNIVLKFIIDGLREWGCLRDDSPAYVNKITTEVIAGCKREYTRVTIF